MWMQINLEFEVRLQQYIELRRTGQLLEARAHVQKYIAQHTDTHSVEIHRAAGLLAYPPDTQTEPYKVGQTMVFVQKHAKDSLISDYVLAISVGFPCQPFPQNPPRAVLPSCSAAPSHRSLCWTFGTQDACMSFHVGE